MPHTKKTITAAFLRTTALLSGLGLLVLGTLWGLSSLARFEEDAARLRRDFMEARQAEVKAEVDEALAMIRDMRAHHEENLRRKVRRRVLEGVEVASRLHEANRAWRSPEEVRQMVRETLRAMRFHEGRGYFFILDRDGTHVLNAARPDLEGGRVMDMPDARGGLLFRDMEAVIREQGEGFVEYLWTRPDAEGADHPKVSFIHLFEPYGWIIGGGEYLEDAEAELKAEVLRRLEFERFGDEGYLFAGTLDGTSLAGPAKGRNMYDVTDAGGVRVVRELIAAARAGGGFVQYVMPPLDGERPYPKVGCAALVEDWGWYVGGGVSVQAVEGQIAERRAQLWAGLRLRSAGLAGALALLLLAQYLVVRRVAGRIQQGLAGFLEALRRFPDAGAELDPKAQPYAELAEGAVTAGRLVAARIRAEAALRDSEARYRRLVDNARDVILLVDQAGRILDVNSLACESLGRSREELARMPVWEVDGLATPESVAGLAAGPPGSSVVRRGLLRRSDGSAYPVEVRVTAFQEKGQPLLLGVARDVSEREAAERELLKAKAEAESASRAKSQFMANMSHELRTPLNGIMGMTRILRDSGCTPEQAEFLDIVRRSSEHLLRIIADILDLSGIEAGRVRVAEEPFSLRQSLAPLLKSCAVQAWRKGLSFDWEVDEAAPERLVGDSGRLAQMVYNLAHNAIKFTAEGGVRVRIGLDGEDAAGGDRVRLACVVSDTGPGIPADKLAQVFERFVQAEDALTRRHGGVGLGLSISRELARLMGGDLVATSEPGAGSVFAFTAAFGLDRAPAAPPEFAPPQDRAARAARALRLLVVEDEPVSRLLAGRMLRMAGHEVLEAGDGAEALDILSRERFDAVLMDVQMPGINGLDATRRIRAGQVPGCDRAAPVIALTAYALEDERNACLAAGMDDFAAKPLDIDDLLQRLDRVVSGRPGREGMVRPPAGD
ncbi:MAG: cache domain-containing protein [Thermodesulfobacteriota bacterium]